MRRMLAEAIVDFLSFSGNASDHLNEIGGFHHRDWEHTLNWLRDAGLSFYLLQKLKDTNATDILPKSALSRLEDNLKVNRRRVARLSRQFNSLNQKFDAAGVKYVVVKGFSLVPQFCPDASLRHQIDLDYLVNRQSLSVAQHVLEAEGYFLKKHSTNEFVFLPQSAQVPVLADEQSEEHAAYAVELHLAFWDSDLHIMFLAEPEFSVENIVNRRWQGVGFRALPEEDAFLLQVIHAFHHLLTGWVRMSWLYEIGYFLNQQATDTLLWGRIERRVGSDPLLREMLAVVTELSAQFFEAPLPSTFGKWVEDIRPTVRIWIRNYARTWAFENQNAEVSLFSTDKLVLFLHQQYLSEASARRHLIRKRLVPLEQFFRRARSITTLSSTNSGERTRQLHRVLVRLLFHVTGSLRFFWEIPRWRRLNKATHPGLQTSVIQQPQISSVFRRVHHPPLSCKQDRAASEKAR